MLVTTQPIAGYEGFYSVNREGQVYSHHSSRYLKGSPDRKGYIFVWLFSDGGRVRRYIHHLVLEAFVGPRPDGMEARHLNGDKTNNGAENLAWGTHSENVKDTVKHGRHNEASKTHCAKGHEFSPENTRTTRTGGRRCRKCHMVWARQAKDKLKARVTA